MSYTPGQTLESYLAEQQAAYQPTTIAQTGGDYVFNGQDSYYNPVVEARQSTFDPGAASQE